MTSALARPIGLASRCSAKTCGWSLGRVVVGEQAGVHRLVDDAADAGAHARQDAAPRSPATSAVRIVMPPHAARAEPGEAHPAHPVGEDADRAARRAAP